jgi:predicted Zn-dependent protease
MNPSVFVKTFTALTLTFVLAGCAVSDRQVIEQADQAHSGLQPAVVRDPELADYIQRLGDRIVEAAREADRNRVGPDAHFKDEDRHWMFSDRMQFHFVNSETMNAFTTGGEHMYIYTALFRACEDENDLAAVMAHEYAHVYGRHVQKGTQRQYGVIGAALAAGAAGAFIGGKENAAQYGTLGAGAAAALGQVAGATFTRRDEAEADKYGFLFYTHAGWDPMDFGHFFQIMIDRGMDKGVAFLSDHPTLASRVDAAREHARELGPDVDRYRRPPVASTGRFRALQDQAARIARTMPNDTTLAQTRELLQALPRSCLTPAVQEDQVRAAKRLQQDLEAQDRRRGASAAPSPAASDTAPRRRRPPAE